MPTYRRLQVVAPHRDNTTAPGFWKNCIRTRLLSKPTSLKLVIRTQTMRTRKSGS